MIRKWVPAVVAAALWAGSLPTAAVAAGATALPDVTGHWAEAEIRTAAADGWVNGYPDGSFKPEGEVTRAEFLKMLSMVRANGSAEEIADQRLSTLYSSLTEQDHWAVNMGYVKGALAQLILEPSDYPMQLDEQGRIAGWTLSPDAPITRLDASVLISRALGHKYESESFWYHPGSQYSPRRDEPKGYFTDRPATWALGWVASAAETGIVKGYPDGTFKGGQPVKRSEAVVILQRVATKASAAWRPTAMIEAPQTPNLLNRDGLYYLNFYPVMTVRFDYGSTWDETGQTWASLPRAYRAKVAQAYAQKFWADVKANDYAPLSVRSITVRFEGQPNQNLGEGHYDGTTFEYLDVNGMAEPATPNTSVDLDAHLKIVPGEEELQAQYDRYLANARVNYQANPPAPSALYTFPYQYLSDWFRADSEELMAYATGRASDLYLATRERLEAIGVEPQPVTVHIAPSNTSGRDDQRESLLIGETLLANPVLTVVYDGEQFQVVHAATSLAEYVGNLKLTYEAVPGGEGGSAEAADPEPAVARQIMETYIYSLGQK